MMTPLGSAARDLVMQIGPNEDWYGLAQSLWTSHGLDSMRYVSQFSSRCAITMMMARNTEPHARTAGLGPYEPKPGAFAPLDDERGRQVGQATWNHLAAIATSFDMDVPDPTAGDELNELAVFEGDGNFVLALWGYRALRNASDHVGNDPQWDRYFDWVLAEFEAIDARLAGA